MLLLEPEVLTIALCFTSVESELDSLDTTNRPIADKLSCAVRVSTTVRAAMLYAVCTGRGLECRGSYLHLYRTAQTVAARRLWCSRCVGPTVRMDPRRWAITSRVSGHAVSSARALSWYPCTMSCTLYFCRLYRRRIYGGTV